MYHFLTALFLTFIIKTVKMCDLRDTIVKKSLLLLMLISCAGFNGFGQISIREIKGGNLNSINTAVPFLSITPDSRAGAIGDVGVATSPDINSQHWNVAKYVFTDAPSAVSISYTPWLRRVIPDISLAYLAAYLKPTDQQVISGSLRYFSMGQLTLTDINGGMITQFTPYEMAIDAGYTRLLTRNFSGGIVFRYIHSNLTNGIEIFGEESAPGRSVAADLGFYYHQNIGSNGIGYAAGASLTNLGTPIGYTSNSEKIPIPSNMRIGGRIDYRIDENNVISGHLEFNKLLVPTKPVMAGDSVIKGYNTPESIVGGIFRSFYDAPGIHYNDGSYSSVFREEIAEVTLGTGVEYWYMEQFAIRAGYFHEAAVKGNRRHFTIGVGIRLNVFSVDFTYLAPTNGQNSPLANTVRFTLGFEFGQ